MKSKKKHVGELILIKFTDRKTPICGVVVDYNDDWTLMKFNPVDYVIDGYVLFKHKNIEGFSKDAEEKFRDKVIKLKGGKVGKEDLIPLSDLASILTHLAKKFDVFKLETKSEKVCYLGRLKSLDRKELVIEYLDPEGKWEGQMKFRLNDIRVIEFDTDYINSLMLVAGHGKRPSVK